MWEGGPPQSVFGQDRSKSYKLISKGISLLGAKFLAHLHGDLNKPYGQNGLGADHLSFSEFQSTVLAHVWTEKKYFWRLAYLQTIQDWKNVTWKYLSLYIVFCWYRKLKFGALWKRVT